MSIIQRRFSPTSVQVSSCSPESLSPVMGASGGAAFSSASNTPTANCIKYIPFTLRETVTVYKLWWHNGANVAGNVDVGIYDANGTRITSSGVTAQSGTNSIQSVTLGTPISIGPGSFYLAALETSTSGRLAMNSTGVEIIKTWGVLEQLSTSPLPATATFGTPTIALTPLVGFSTIPTL